MYTAAKCEWNFSIYNHESISEEKIFTRFLIKIFLLKYISRIKDQFSIENDVMAMWGEHKRRNALKFKNILWKGNTEKSE